MAAVEQYMTTLIIINLANVTFRIDYNSLNSSFANAMNDTDYYWTIFNFDFLWFQLNSDVN